MKISVFVSGEEHVFSAEVGERLMDVLFRNHIQIPTACGGRGSCKKCRVQLLKGQVDGTQPDADASILSCKAYLKEPITIAVSAMQENHDTLAAQAPLQAEHRFGIAFDLGTTTLAFSLVDIDAKKRIASFSALNPQQQFGADVISRISAANDGHLLNLHTCIIREAQNAIAYFKKAYAINSIDCMAVAGNTTMLHIFLNVSPKSIGVAPYTPVFTEARSLSGAALSLDCARVEILPSFSAFVGADIAAGAYAIDLPSNAMLIDLGTNGELLYRKDEMYYATSTAAGPCLEGASMDCGIGGVKGAIAKVYEKNQVLQFETIAKQTPCGICGAGYVDAISALLSTGEIDETGALTGNQDKIFLTESIYISDADVRKFQLAKSAIASGICSLLHEIDIPIETVSTFYLAGGIGYYVDIAHAVAVGLLPKQVAGKVKVIGNSSLLGTEKFLWQNDAKEKTTAMTAHVKEINLNQSAYFNNAYIENMMFF